MTAEIVTFSLEAERDLAWRRYLDLYDQAEADPRLKRDREHVNAMILAHERYRKLFLATEGGR